MAYLDEDDYSTMLDVIDEFCLDQFSDEFVIDFVVKDSVLMIEIEAV